MFKLITKNKLQYFKSQILKDFGFEAIFTTRIGGFSKSPYHELNLGFHTNDENKVVLNNRKKLFETLNYNPNNIIFSEQVHSNKIKYVDKNDKFKGVFSYKSSIPKIDGMITRDESIVLGGLFADCVPIYIVDKNKGYFSLIHSGWKGTFNNILGITLNYFINELESNYKDIIIIIGPSISKNAYEIDYNLVIKFKDKYNFINQYMTKENDKYYLDLKELNKQIAINFGIDIKNIFKSDLCTHGEEKLFYSYRRDGGKTGRMAALITRKYSG